MLTLILFISCGYIADRILMFMYWVHSQLQLCQTVSQIFASYFFKGWTSGNNFFVVISIMIQIVNLINSYFIYYGVALCRVYSGIYMEGIHSQWIQFTIQFTVWIQLRHWL